MDKLKDENDQPLLERFEKSEEELVIGKNGNFESYDKAIFEIFKSNCVMLKNSNLQHQNTIEDKYTFYYDILNAMYDVLMKQRGCGS